MVWFTKLLSDSQFLFNGYDEKGSHNIDLCQRAGLLLESVQQCSLLLNDVPECNTRYHCPDLSTVADYCWKKRKKKKKTTIRKVMLISCRTQAHTHSHIILIGQQAKPRASHLSEPSQLVSWLVLTTKTVWGSGWSAVHQSVKNGLVIVHRCTHLQ